METAVEEEQIVDRLAKKNTKTSIPIEIIEEIISRLPVKSILRFRSVSKSWLSHISHPSFTKLHSTRATLNLFILAYADYSTGKQYLLSAPSEGGPVTHLITLDHPYALNIMQPQHLNGLIIFTYQRLLNGRSVAQPFVFNPSTRKSFILPDPPPLVDYAFGAVPIVCFFGFDESRNQHKVLMIKKLYYPTRVEVMVFCMANRLWKKIDAEPPTGFSWERLHYKKVVSVCVNSVVHIMLRARWCCILAFDLRTDKFSLITTPQGVFPREPFTSYTRNKRVLCKSNQPRIIKINGRVGIVCHDSVVENGEIHVWMLEDYENRVWVRETIKLPGYWDSWVKKDYYYPVPLDVDTDDIIFSWSEVSDNVMSVPIYNKKTGSFNLLQFTLGHQFLCSEIVRFSQVRRYIESVVSL